MQVKSIAECSKGREHSAILSTFINLPFVIKIVVLSIFEWPFYTGFTVFTYNVCQFVCLTLGMFGDEKHVLKNTYNRFNPTRSSNAPFSIV